MIRTALDFVRGELEAFMIDREQDPANYKPGEVVVVKSIILPNGNVNTADSKHITLMLAGLEEERREGKRPVLLPADKNNFFRLNPPVEINLFMLFIAQNAENNYETAVRDLSDVLAFFQANPVFDQQKFPLLNASVDDPEGKPWRLIDRLSFRLHNLTFEQQNNLWAMLGSKYIPSVVYKMSLLTLFATRSKEKIPSITEINFKEN